MARTDLTAQRLRELLNYDARTGVFTWRRSKGRARAGKVAGTPHSAGYVQICIDGVLHFAHRLAWLYALGEHPMLMIDHINGDCADNRLINLREADHTLNGQNQRRASVRNKSCGLLGVSTADKKFRAEIKSGDRHIHLGRFETPEAAHAAYLAAKRKLHEGCTI